MSCGHEGCTCGPQTPTDRDSLPVTDDATVSHGCCGGHGGGSHHDAPEPDVTRPRQPQAQ